jgi:3-oxoacyl-[acyl-carrier-protein] synthase II
VEGFDPKDIARPLRRTMGRMAVMASLAARDAVADAGLSPEALSQPSVGVSMGSTTGAPHALEQFFRNYISTSGMAGTDATLFMKIMSHTVAANVAAVLAARGRLLAPNSACASSTQAIGFGYEQIRFGLQEIMVCGGADDLHPTTAGVFDVVAAASRNFNDRPTLTPRPFDRDRDGLVVSEGAGVVVLESLDAARARNAPIYAEVLGYGTNCNANQMVQLQAPDILDCMRQALDSAGVKPLELDYINAHATATPHGDAAEAEALRALVGDAVPVSGTKGYTGHSLAACGAMETIFCLLMMRRGVLVPTLNLECVSADCEGLAHVRTLTERRPRKILTSNFAFGGVNASLVLGQV